MTRCRMPALLLAFVLFRVWPGLAGVEISEFMANNETTLATSAGLFEDWIEIHNNSGAAVDLAGWYLSDDPADLRKWQFPSTAATSPLPDDGYLIVFADNAVDAVIGAELHASFKLGSGGEFLALIEPDGETVAHQYSPEYPQQSADISFGVDAGTGAQAYFASPTPGHANGQAISHSVRFSVNGGPFTIPFSLTLSVPSPATTTIRYTLDGSLPTSLSEVYEAPIPISGTTRVRARSFTDGLVDGMVSTETFLHLAGDAAAFTSEIPVVVLENFGAGEVPHPDSISRQASHVMIFEPVNGVCCLTNSPSVTSRAGLRRRGESTLRNTGNKPNLSLETWGEIDEESRAIKPLGMPAESDWILYAPWTIDTAMIRNPFIYEVSNQAGRYAVRTRFVEVFLNYGGGSLSEADDYYGLYILMERIKQGADRVDVAELPGTVDGEPDISGGYIWKLDKDDPNDQNFTAAGKTLTSVYPSTMPPDQLNWLTTHLNTIDTAIPGDNYESLLDVAALADHHILNVFANNADGLQLSTFYHKDRGGLVQMGPIWDFDRSMGCDNDARASDPEVWSLATDPAFFFHSGGPLWFRDLAFNDPEFWVVWTDRWQAMREGPLSDAAMIERIERFRREIANAAIRNYTKWPGVLGTSEWSGKVDVMRQHVITRGQWIDDQLIDPPVFNHLGGRIAEGFQLTVSGPQTQYFTLDGSDPRARGGAPAGSLYSTSITINTNTLVRCRSWNGANFVNAPSTWPWSALSEVMLVVNPAPLAITEIMYHPRPPSGVAELVYTASDFEFIEVQNTSSSSCSLVGVQFLEGVKFDFTDGSNSVLSGGGYGVVVRNLDAFKVRYADWESRNVLGTYTGRLSNGSENLKLGYAPTNMPPLVSFDYEDDWYPSTDGEGFSLVLDDPQGDPDSWDSKQAWRPSAAPDGSPGMSNPPLAYPQGAVVINEVLSHQDSDNPGDWIELHNTTSGPINIGGWFLSDSRGDLQKYTVPGETVIPANGYLVLTEHDHFGSVFALSEHGDSVYLSAGSSGELSVPAYREVQEFGGQDRDVTFGRLVRSNGVSDFVAMLSPTMGTANSGPKVGPVVIEEIMYHPPTNGHEYILIANTSGAPVPLYDPLNPSNVWKVAGIDFTFPTGIQLAAENSLLLVRDSITPAQFRSAYGVPASIEIFNYPGALDNDTDTIAVRRPGVPEGGTGFVPYILVEQVKYNDGAPWPPAADGLGKALVRINPAAYANDPANWQAGDATYAPAVSTLIVHAGSGDGAYTGGTVVRIVADAPPPGQVFIKWIGNVAAIANVENPTTTMSMPGQDVTVSALYSTVHEVFIPEDAIWKYHDQGQDLGTAWRATVYNDTAWPGGAAQLGYGEQDEATVIGFGDDADNKHITTYFRKTFTVTDPSLLASLKLRLLRDDGAVVYINGNEVVRDVMPAGSIDYLTPSSGIVGGAAEDTFFDFALSPAVLDAGTNVMAVEIHQQAGNSSDVSFAAELSGLAGEMATADGDADGMHDAWEIDRFGSTEAGLPWVDNDGDGIWNVDEFVAGTQPTNAASFFSIEQVDASGLSWPAVPGRIYSVEWTHDLRLPFIPIASGLTKGGYTDNTHTNSTANYYRLRVELE